MKPKKLRVPALFHHKAVDQDAVCIRDADGKRRMIYLGKRDSPEARQRYGEVIGDYLAGRRIEARAKAKRPPSIWPTVESLCAEYLTLAARYYLDPDGTPTGRGRARDVRVRDAAVPLPRGADRSGDHRRPAARRAGPPAQKGMAPGCSYRSRTSKGCTGRVASSRRSK
jgi:hypothetical protein